MPDSTPANPSPEPSNSKKRAARGFIDQELEDALELAENCAHEAVKAEVTPKLTEREWTAAQQTLLTTSLDRCDDLIESLKEKRTGKRTLTQAEEAARTELLHALDPIVKGAARKYAKGSAERRAYGAGARLSNSALSDLYAAAVHAHGQLAPGENNTAPKDVLPGVLSVEITAISTLAEQYKEADFAQGDTQQTAAQLLAVLKKEIETVLNPLRRDLQGAADQAYTHRDPVNAAQRTAFGLQPDRSLVS